MSNVICSCLLGDNARIRLRLSQLLQDEIESLYEESPEEPAGEPLGDICEVEMAGCLREFFLNNTGIPLEVGQPVIVESDGGYDFGVVYSTGPIARKKYRLKGLDRKGHEKPVILRLATKEDLELLHELRREQEEISSVCTAKVRKHALNLKLVDVELRMDRQKLSVYYTSTHRVDFRALVRDLAAEFKARIQMVQITTREEARRANAYGPCGCLLCCSSWLQKIQANPFADKVQHIDMPNGDGHAFNITGLCNKPKCCLNYSPHGEECSATQPRLPAVGSRVSTPDGPAVVESVDAAQEAVTLRYRRNDQTRRVSLERFNAMFSRTRPQGGQRRRS